MKTMLILVIQLKNAVVPNAVAPCCQNIVAMLLCGRAFQKMHEYWSMKGPINQVVTLSDSTLISLGVAYQVVTRV